MSVYYNENDSFAAAWLRNLIAENLIAPGDVDERSILEVKPEDLRGYKQCHFFAGIGGWSYALRLAMWPDDRPVWTGSCPCQPFSVAGKKKGFEDERHLWPVWFNLIKECSPSIVFGEQVASAAEWINLVRSNLEAEDYAFAAIPMEAASAGAFHLRDRYWFVAHSDQYERGIGNEQRSRQLAESQQDQTACVGGYLAHAISERGCSRYSERQDAEHADASSEGIEWSIGSDGKARPVKPGVCLLAHGVPNRIPTLRGFGNAIDPRPAAQFIIAARYSLA